MLTTIEKVLLLKQVSLFSPLSGEPLARLANVAIDHMVDPGQVIFSKDDVGESLFSIVHGTVSLVSDSQPPLKLGQGQSFGELSLFDSETRVCTAVADDETSLLEIEQSAFRAVMDDTPELAWVMVSGLAFRCRGLMQVQGQIALPDPTNPVLADQSSTGIPKIDGSS